MGGSAVDTPRPPPPPPLHPPLRVGVIEAARIIGVSRAQLYKIIKSGAISVVKEGRHTLLTIKELRSFVERDQ